MGLDATFELPTSTQTAFEAASQDGQPPWSFINKGRFVDGIGVRKSGGAQPGSFYGAPATTLAGIPATARFLAVSGRAADFDRLPDFRNLEVVQVYGRVSDREISVLAQLSSVRMLSMYGIRATNADPLAALRNLEHLHCDDAPKLAALQFLADLPKLQTLWLEHFRGLKELSQIGELTRLRGLVLAGSMWTALRVASLTPLANLRQLLQLHFVNVRVGDGSLAPLTRLKDLRQLRIPNWFTMAEFAALAAFLPATEGRFHSVWFVDPKPVGEPGYSTCTRCRRYSLGLTLGKPMRRLCPQCDAAKVARLTAQWETLVAQVRPTG